MEACIGRKVVFANSYENLDVHHDREAGVLWYYMKPRPRPCFSPALLGEIRHFQQHVYQLCSQSEQAAREMRFLVLASRTPGVFNLGGDLALFFELIKRRDRAGLERYARACIDVLYPNAVSLDLPVTTLALVQGNALGGGFEAALSSNVLVAERSASMGLPEILFNLFPGMGAYSFLSRRLDPARAERMILSGRNYTAAELHDLGVVDVLAEDGEGERAVYDYVRKHDRSRNGIMAVHAVRRRVNPVSYEELIDVTLMWVSAALRLEQRDLRVMERLVRAQNRLVETRTQDEEDMAVA